MDREDRRAEGMDGREQEAQSEGLDREGIEQEDGRGL